MNKNTEGSEKFLPAAGPIHLCWDLALKSQAQTLPTVEHLLEEKNAVVEAATGRLSCQLYWLRPKFCDIL